MSKGTTNWESVETWERLVASIFATGVKVDLKAAAAYYGTTYHTLENRLRKTKKLAKELEAAAGGNVTPMAKQSTPRKPKTPNDSPVNRVANGRVTKETPTKRTKKKEIKPKSTTSDADGEDQRHGSFAFDIPTPEDDDMLPSSGMHDTMQEDFGVGFF